jgi:O-antigen/teichoic acid export membrane protein
MGLSKRVINATIYFTLLRYISFFIGIVGQVILARLLMPDDFIPFVLSIAFIDIVYSFGGIGINDAILLYQKEKNV